MKPRRWFRFSLRTMFVLLTLFCIWLGWNVDLVRTRKELALDELMEVCIDVEVADHPPELSWIRRLLGDQTYPFVIQKHGYSKAQLIELHAVCPEMGVPITDRDIEATRWPGKTQAQLDQWRNAMRKQIAEQLAREVDNPRTSLPSVPPEVPR